MANGYHTRTTLRDFAGRERYLFLRPTWGIKVRRWIRKLMGGGK